MNGYETAVDCGREESRPQRRRKRRLLRAGLAVLLAVLMLGGGFLLWQKNRRLPGEGVVLPEYVTENFLPVNRFSRPGIPLEKIDGVVIHYVGNPATSAEANRNYFASLANGREGTFASSHFIVGLEGEVLQCVPLTEIAYASKERNSDTVAIEVCHPDETGEFSDATYEQVVELTAWLCQTFELNPQADVIRHYDVTGKVCPRYYVEYPEAWVQFLKDTEATLEMPEKQN